MMGFWSFLKYVFVRRYTEVKKIEIKKIIAERWDGKTPFVVGSNALPLINLDEVK